MTNNRDNHNNFETTFTVLFRVDGGHSFVSDLESFKFSIPEEEFGLPVDVAKGDEGAPSSSVDTSVLDPLVALDCERDLLRLPPADIDADNLSPSFEVSLNKKANL